MKIWRTFFLNPFRIFSSGDSFFNSKKSHKGLTQQITKPSVRHISSKRKVATSSEIGWKHGKLFCNVMAFVTTTLISLYLIAFIEKTPEFVMQYGTIGIGNWFEKFGLTVPMGERALFYQYVLTKAVCSSEIALIQILIIYFLLFSGFRLLFCAFGAMSAGKRIKCPQSLKGLVSLSIITLPALGILSTVLGILSAENISREEAKIIIFGPSGLGILGFLIANFINYLIEVFDDK